MYSARSGPLNCRPLPTAWCGAQYGPGVSDGIEIPGYLHEREVAPDSLTETFVAWKVEIDNWRWQGVPFYLRTGKALAAKVTEVNIVFRKPPLLLFETLHGDKVPPSNVLMLRIQPDESIRLYFDAKRPGPSVNIERVAMDFSYREQFGNHPAADAYERLLLDAIVGDTTLVYPARRGRAGLGTCNASARRLEAPRGTGQAEGRSASAPEICRRYLGAEGGTRATRPTTGATGAIPN